MAELGVKVAGFGADSKCILTVITRSLGILFLIDLTLVPVGAGH